MLCISTSRILRSERLFGFIAETVCQESDQRVGRMKERAFKDMLVKSGISDKVSHEIWNWYTK